MTEYTPRNGQELNSLLANTHMVIPHYSSTGDANYIYSDGQVPYTTLNAVYPTYTNTYSPSDHAAHFEPENSRMAFHYQQNPSHLATSLTQSRTHTTPQYLQSRSSTQRCSYANRAVLQHESQSIIETEDQDSFNRESMRSEPVSPPLEGYPDVKEFDHLMRR